MEPLTPIAPATSRAAVIAAVLCFGIAGSSHASSIDGFVKNFFIVQRLPGYDPAVPGGEVPPARTLVANSLRARLSAGFNPRDWTSLDFAYELAPRWQNDDFALLQEELIALNQPAYRVDDLDPVLLPRDPGAGDNFIVTQNLDRASVMLSAPAFDFIIGRQAVAWGSARSINPTDVIAPFLLTEIDTENRIGVDAFRLRAPTGQLGEIDVGYVAGANLDIKKSAVYARGRFYQWQTDIALIAMRFREHDMIGVDVVRSIAGAGTWLEAATVFLKDAPPPSDVEHEVFERDHYTRVSAGLDYGLGNGTYLFAEYHFNGAGVSDPADFRYVQVSPAVSDAAVFLFGRHYVIPGVTWPATPLWTIAVSGFVSLTDGSVLASPLVEYNVSDNFYLAAAAFLGIGERPVYDPPDSQSLSRDAVLVDPLAVDYRSEFGTYPKTYYAELRYYY